jgi:hypothetical protein
MFNLFYWKNIFTLLRYNIKKKKREKASEVVGGLLFRQVWSWFVQKCRWWMPEGRPGPGGVFVPAWILGFRARRGLQGSLLIFKFEDQFCWMFSRIWVSFCFCLARQTVRMFVLNLILFLESFFFFFSQSGLAGWLSFVIWWKLYDYAVMYSKIKININLGK